MGNSTLERGFQLFKKKKISGNISIGHSEHMVQNNMFTFPTCWRPRICILFHRKTAVTNQNIFRTLKHVFRKSEYCSTEFLHSRKLTQFPESTDSVEEGTKFASRERLPKSDKVNIFAEIPLWVRFSLLTQSAHGPGEDPFEAVMCTVGAASQISWMLTEDICF